MTKDERIDLLVEGGNAPTMKDLFEARWTEAAVEEYNADLERGISLLEDGAFGRYLCKEFIELIDPNHEPMVGMSIVREAHFRLRILYRFNPAHILERLGLQAHFKFFGVELLEKFSKEVDKQTHTENNCEGCEIREMCADADAGEKE